MDGEHRELLVEFEHMYSGRQSLPVNVQKVRGQESTRGQLLLFDSAPELRVNRGRSNLGEPCDGANASTVLGPMSGERPPSRVGSIQYSDT